MYVKFHPKFLNVKLAKQQGFQSTGTHLNDMKLFLCLLFSHNFRCNTNEGPSGFGFELTFRLKRESGETNPPTWPATLMQALARYVFQTGECLQCVVILACSAVGNACTNLCIYGIQICNMPAVCVFDLYNRMLFPVEFLLKEVFS